VSVAMNLITPKPELLHDEPMSRHTSWRVGGPAERFFKPDSIESLQDFLRSLAAETELHWVGLGSNLLVRDGGVAGVVICTLNLPTAAERVGETDVRVGAGVPCTVFARQCVRWKLGPAAFFAGIPGTVGGALAMNAGAFGGETWELVEAVHTISRDGSLRRRMATEYRIGYRSVAGPGDEWFTGAELRLSSDSDGGAAVRIKELLRLRAETQPMGTRNCGSVFRNPPGDHAARLIEASGLKGERVGSAVVSEKHANFIINADDASAADVEQLINHVQQTVADQQGVELVHEVRIVGNVTS